MTTPRKTSLPFLVVTTILVLGGAYFLLGRGVQRLGDAVWGGPPPKADSGDDAPRR